jgi:pyridoxamine 5'-phosphate oxidase
MSLKTIARTIGTLGKGVHVGIPAADDGRNPFDLFDEWYRAAEESGLLHPEAMALSTASPDGMPSSRMVLLKERDATGFVFYTNLGSRKCDQLRRNPRAALVLHWAVLERQVRIEGRVEEVDREQAAAYFASRPRGSRIGAWASRQSETLPDRQTLDERMKRYEQEFEGDDVPLPPFWGGWRVVPAMIEFWQGKANRLHDRLVFTAGPDGWETRRLYP